jgi:hypothetical protein
MHSDRKLVVRRDRVVARDVLVKGAALGFAERAAVGLVTSLLTRPDALRVSGVERNDLAEQAGFPMISSDW